MGGGDLSLTNHQGMTALMVAVVQKHDDAVARLLQDPRVTAMAQDATGRTALHWACALGSSACADLLVTMHLETVFAESDNGDTPCHTAVLGDHTDVIDKLLNILSAKQQKKLLGTPNAAGLTPLGLARAVSAGKRQGRPIPPQRGSIRFCPLACTCAPWGCIVRADELTKSRKIPTRKTLPLFCVFCVFCVFRVFCVFCVWCRQGRLFPEAHRGGARARRGGGHRLVLRDGPALDFRGRERRGLGQAEAVVGQRHRRRGRRQGQGQGGRVGGGCQDTAPRLHARKARRGSPAGERLSGMPHPDPCWHPTSPLLYA